MKVRITRTRFTGPVSVALAEPSAGVTIAPNPTSFQGAAERLPEELPSSDGRELVQTHNDLVIFQAAANERLVIDTVYDWHGT